MRYLTLKQCEIIDNKEDADTVFSLDEGITPFDIDEINARYIA